MVRVLRWAVVVFASVDAGYMVVDGLRALIVGDYFTPSSGEHAGELGPWATFVQAVGIAPRSTTMKVIFVGYGLVWLAVVVAFARGASWSPWAMAGLAAGSLWYLWVGTVSSLVQLMLLGVLTYQRSP